MSGSRPGLFVMLMVLCPVFALTGVVDAITGPLLPSLAHSFQLSDSQTGSLVFCIFCGMAFGALLCQGNYARVMVTGLMAMAVGCLFFPWVPRDYLYPYVFFFGVSTGAPMTAISLFAGRNYPARRASVLSILNFCWSIGALLAPLLVGQMVASYSWHAVYFVLSSIAMLAVLGVALTIRDTEEMVRISEETEGMHNLRLLAIFALFFFFEVGCENMMGTWITTYILRSAATTLSYAAASTALYWGGFLTTRAVTPLLLLHLSPRSLIRLLLSASLGAMVLMVSVHNIWLLLVAIFLLGASLAPLFPVALAALFARCRHSSDSRIVLSISGFGGAVVPWCVGQVSAWSGSLRIGLCCGVLVLLSMIVLLPQLKVSSKLSGESF